MAALEAAEIQGVFLGQITQALDQLRMLENYAQRGDRRPNQPEDAAWQRRVERLRSELSAPHFGLSPPSGTTLENFSLYAPTPKRNSAETELTTNTIPTPEIQGDQAHSMMQLCRARQAYLGGHFQEAIQYAQSLIEQKNLSPSIREEGIFQLALAQEAWAGQDPLSGGGIKSESVQPLLEAQHSYEKFLEHYPHGKHHCEAALGLITILELRGEHRQALQRLDQLSASSSLQPAERGIVQLRRQRIRQRGEQKYGISP